jgi:hypothetical protein
VALHWQQVCLALGVHFSHKIGCNKREPLMKKTNLKIFDIVMWIGNLLTAMGCLGLVLGLAGVFNLDSFAYGLSSGIRIVGSVAIAGCLLSAIGSGVLDYTQTK